MVQVDGVSGPCRYFVASSGMGVPPGAVRYWLVGEAARGLSHTLSPIVSYWWLSVPV